MGIPTINPMSSPIWANDMEQIAVLKADPNVHSLVIYCDAGAKPNPGFAGAGFHGYVWVPKETKNSSGHPTHNPTSIGYHRKSDLRAGVVANANEVDVVQYVDGILALGGNRLTNNYGEIVATCMALEIAIELDVTNILLYTDSKLVVEAFNKWIYGWAERNWLRNGTPIPNKELWERLLRAKETLKKSGKDVDIQHIYGHTGDVGNERADTQACVGTELSKAGLHDSYFQLSPPLRYWTYNNERHPMLNSTVMYYVNSESHVQPGRYYLGSHGKDDRLIGTSQADGRYAIVEIDETDPILEMVRKRTIDEGIRRKQELGHVVSVRLDAAYRPETHKFLELMGGYALMTSSGHVITLTSTATKEPVASVINPARNSFRVVEALNEIATVYQEYKDGKDHIVHTDLTPILYETVMKKRGKQEEPVTNLKAEYGVGYSVLKVDANHLALEGKLSQDEVRLLLGMDLPTRNALKRLEGLNPKVTLITWTQPDTVLVFRYAVVVEAQGCRGIWSSHYSNYRFLTEHVPNAKGKDQVVKVSL